LPFDKVAHIIDLVKAAGLDRLGLMTRFVDDAHAAAAQLFNEEEGTVASQASR